MSKHFKDPIAVKERRTSSTFVAPNKAQATTGRFMPPGDDYGIGHRQPVGKSSASNEGPIPRKSFCFPNAEAIRD